MSLATAPLDRLAPSQRPPGLPAGYHRWHDLLFLHWRVPENVLRPLVPAPLAIDTLHGEAFVGLVAFWLSGVRARRWPALPWLSCFAETNVRTYVVLPGGEPGVWFLSLDAARLPAVLVARAGWHLPYCWSRMRVSRREAGLRYASRRRWPGPWGARSDLQLALGGEPAARDALCSPVAEHPSGLARPGTLTHFLVERYTLYCADRRGRLYTARVHHAPYPLRSVRLAHCEQTLLPAAGVPIAAPPDHVVYSPGVSVEVFPLRRIEE